jgi:hypothetical protein
VLLSRFQHLCRRRLCQPLRPQGLRGVAVLGHRAYVGGLWDELGHLQFDFLLAHGLRRDSYLLDVACGSLRLGVHAIPFLAPGHYLGLDKEAALVRAGLATELDAHIQREKRPTFVISSSFEFDKFGQRANIAVAQSLFTHLPEADIRLCLQRLLPWIATDGVLYATYFETDQPRRNPTRAHDHAYFAYARSEMVAFGEDNGYCASYLGDWNHPRGQVMVEYRPRIAKERA